MGLAGGLATNGQSGGGGGAAAPLTLTGASDVTELTIVEFSGQTSKSFKITAANTAELLSVDQNGSLALAQGVGTGNITMAGSLDLNTVGQGIKVKEGANGKQGVATLAAGTVTVSTTTVTANSRIFLTCNTPGGTPGWLQVSARTAGTSFTILSSSNTDTSVVAYQIFEPG